MKKHPWYDLMAVYSKDKLLKNPINAFNVYCSRNNGVPYKLNAAQINRLGFVVDKNQQDTFYTKHGKQQTQGGRTYLNCILSDKNGTNVPFELMREVVFGAFMRSSITKGVKNVHFPINVNGTGTIYNSTSQYNQHVTPWSYNRKYIWPEEEKGVHFFAIEFFREPRGYSGFSFDTQKTPVLFNPNNYYNSKKPSFDYNTWVNQSKTNKDSTMDIFTFTATNDNKDVFYITYKNSLGAAYLDNLVKSNSVPVNVHPDVSKLFPFFVNANFVK